MTRTVLSAATVVLLLASLSACARPAPERDVVTISFACRDYLRSWYRELADAFQKEHPGIAVQILSIEEILERRTSGGVGIVSSDDIVKVAHAADTYVDDARMLGDRPQDVALDLADLAARDGELLLEDFLPAALALFQRGKGLWALPLEVDTTLLYYSPERFDEAGLPYPEAGWSWDDFLDAAVRLTIREEERVVEYGFVDPFAYSLVPLLVRARAGPLIEARHGVAQARLDDPRVAEALQWYADMVTRYGVMPDPREVDSLALQRLPHEASPAMWLSGSWYRDEFASAGIVPLPESDGVGVASVSAKGAIISAGTTHPREAWRWVAFLSEQPPFKYSDAIPARESVIRATGTWRKMDSMLAAAFQYNLEHAVDVPGTLRGALSRAYKAVLEGAAVEGALAEEQTRADEILVRLAEASDQPVEAFTVAPPAPASSGEAIEIRFRVLSSGELDLYRTLAQHFEEAHPGIHVQVEPSSNWPIAEQAAEADCFLSYAYGVRESREGLLALDPLLAEDEGYRTDVFYPDYLAPLLVDGTLWGLPLDTDARLLYYDRDRFDQADEPYPSADWTPRDLVVRALDLTDLDAPEPRYGFYPTLGAYVDAATYVVWLGGQLFDAQGQPTFADPMVVEATALYAALITGAAPPQAQERAGDRLSGVAVTWGERPGPIQSGHVGMWVDDHEHHVAAGALDFTVGVAPLPPGVVSFNATLRALYVSANAPHPGACSFMGRFPVPEAWAREVSILREPQAMVQVSAVVAKATAGR